MPKLTIGGKFEWFMNTLEECGIFVRKLSDREIEFYIFEELIIDAGSFLYQDNLEELEENGFISSEIKENALLLREKILGIKHTYLWNIESIRKSSEWLEIFELSDDIKREVHKMWTDEELEALKK